MVHSGPKIDYQADTNSEGCGGPDGHNYKIQSFAVNIGIQKGDYIALKDQELGFIHSSSSGGVLVFDPALATGHSYSGRMAAPATYSSSSPTDPPRASSEGPWHGCHGPS